MQATWISLKSLFSTTEGFYGGGEHAPSHPLFALPTHGANVYPAEEQVPGMKAAILAYTEEVTELGKLLCDAINVALGLPTGWMRENILCGEGPVQLFRSFHYVGKQASEGEYGIGEHTDFGLLTILSPHGPGLQVLSPTNEWIDVPLIEDSFVVNVGDILDRMTDGLYCSRPHRVLPPPAGTDRLSIPFFFDPSWTASIRPFPLPESKLKKAEEHRRDSEERWAKTTFTGLDGIWGQYLAVKVCFSIVAELFCEFADWNKILGEEGVPGDRYLGIA